MSLRKPPKLENICKTAKHCIDRGLYRYTAHALCRKLERNITELDALHVIKAGWRVPMRDEYCLVNKGWKYAFEGKTLQDEIIRVIIGFDDDMMLIITVMYVTNKD